MKIFLIILFALFTSFCFSQSKNNNNRIFNVKLFGAKGDGTTNDTRSIQAAINACNSAGGGTVWFPNGIYIVGDTLYAATSNSQLFIPVTANSSALRNHITFRGETRPPSNPAGLGLPGDAGTPLVTATTIIRSTLTSGSAGAAIIGTAFFNETALDVENLMLVVKNNPSGSGPVVGGINYKNGGTLNCNYVAVTIDTSGVRSTFPTNDVAGIEYPDNNHDQQYSLSNCIVSGFKSGYKIGEHVVISNAIAAVCYYGFNFKAGYHTSASTRVGCYWCAYDVFISGFCTLAPLHLDTEFRQVGNWYDDIATVKDTANVAEGTLYYSIIVSGCCNNNSKFSKVGASLLKCLSDSEGVISHVSKGDVITSASAKGVFFGGAGGVLAQASTKFAYDSTKGLGINVASPAVSLDISDATSGYTVQIENTGTLTGPSITMKNNNGTRGGFQLGGSGNGGNQVPNNFGIFADSSIILVPDDLVSSGGKHAVIIKTGGTGAGQERARFASNGAFMVNTTTDSTSAKAIFKNSILSDSLTGQTSSGGTLTLSSTTNATKGKILFGTSAYDQANNRLGVNQASPSAKLEVGAVAGVNGGISLNLLANGGTAATSYGEFGFTVPTTGEIGQFLASASNFSSTTNLAANSIGLFAEATSGQLGLGAGGSSGFITFNTGGFGSANERMRIASTGIVTLNKMPTATGTPTIVTHQTDSTLSQMTIANLATAIGTVPSDWHITGNTGVSLPDTSTTWLGTTNNTPLRFKTNGTGRMIIDSIGRVGIGTKTPTQVLDVTGIINASSYVISAFGIYGNAALGEGLNIDAAGHNLSFITNSTQWIRVDGSGRMGVGALSPTALINIKAGTATANTAPLKFTAGVILTTPESGSVETNSTNDLFYTNSGAVRAQVGMWSYIAKTASYTATNSDFTVDFTSNTDTLTLPTATGIIGRVYIVINSTAASICVVQSTGSQVIGNGGILTSQNIPVGSSMTLQSTGTAWRIE